MSVVLVFPKYVPNDSSASVLMPTHPPLGIAYLGAFLKARGIRVCQVDMNFSSRAHLDATIVTHDTRLLGLSINSYTFDRCRELACDLKRLHPGLRIVMGGLAAPYLLHHLRDGGIDYFVLGEGETPLLELIRHVETGQPELEDIANIAFLRGSDVVTTPRAAPSVAIDDLPFPDRDDLGVGRYATTVRQALLFTSRGCPHSCGFCLSGQLKDKVRIRSVDNVVAEISEIKARYPFLNRLRLGDETLNLGRRRMVELCEALGRQGMRWIGNIRPDDDVDDELLTLVHQSGASLLEIGGESGNQEILDRIGRRTRLDRLETILACTTRLGLPVLVTFLYPHYCDTKTTLADTLTLMEHLMHRYLAMVIGFPTSVPEKVGYSAFQEEFALVLGPDAEILSTKYLSSAEVTQARSRARELAYLSHAKYGQQVMEASGLAE